MKTLIIVEGKSDTNRLKKVLGNVQTFETSGLGLDEEKISYLKKINDDYKLIVFTDPDGPGEVIRKRLSEELHDLYHAYLPNNKALSKKQTSIGVEHAKGEDIKKALENLYQESNASESYEISDLVNWGIYSSKLKRTYLCDKLHIAYGNNQKVLKQLNNFNIKREMIEKILEEL